MNKRKLLLLSAVLLGSSITGIPAFAKTVQPKPTLDMVALSFTSTANNSFNFGSMPDPFDTTNHVFNSIRFSLPTGNDYFWTFAYVSNIPKGIYYLKMEITSPNNQLEGVTTSRFLSTGNNYDNSIDTSWKKTKIASGYNSFKVFLDGKFLGQATYWG
jgi:hypothetical protein